MIVIKNVIVFVYETHLNTLCNAKTIYARNTFKYSTEFLFTLVTNTNVWVVIQFVYSCILGNTKMNRDAIELCNKKTI